MKTMSNTRRASSRKIWFPIVAILLIALGAGGYFYWTTKTAAAAQSSSSVTKTSTARTGNLTISVSGSGTLTPGDSSNLSFPVDGTVTKLNVKVGDKVKKDDVLAELSGLATLQDAITTAQVNLNSVQDALDTLKAGAAANLANAQLAVADAEDAVNTAKSGEIQKGWARCDSATIDAYYYKYTHAVEVLQSLGDGGGNADYYLKILVPQKTIVAQAKSAYETCIGYTDTEVASSQATLSLAEATLKEKQATLDKLTKNNGLDPVALSTAENKVVSAQLALEKAKETLDEATIKAPFDGTILTVAAEAGATIDSGVTFITIADLAHPTISFSVDETDMDKLYVGEEATITFDALSGKTFKGAVTLINPALTSSNGYQVVTGTIKLDLTNVDEATSAKLIKGLNATIELVQASAQNAVLIPVEAVHNLGDGTYSVFVMGSDGQPKMKVVEVGIMDAVSAVIKSGVTAGEVVTTGTTQTN